MSALFWACESARLTIALVPLSDEKSCDEQDVGFASGFRIPVHVDICEANFRSSA